MSSLPAHQSVEGSPSIQGPLPHTCMSVSIAYERCLVLIDTCLYTALPAPPTSVTAVQTGPTSVNVSWSALISGSPWPVTRYDIYYVANRGPSTSGGSTNCTSHVLTNLQLGAHYTISVIAVSMHLPSQMITVMLTLSECSCNNNYD